MFVQTFATVRSCIPPFAACCLFEPNCTYNFSEGAEGCEGLVVRDAEKKGALSGMLRRCSC